MVRTEHVTFGLLSWLPNNAATSRSYRVDDRMINECGVVGGMRLARRNRSTRRKSAPMPFCPP
jgi:hypothetical protein